MAVRKTRKWSACHKLSFCTWRRACWPVLAHSSAQRSRHCRRGEHSHVLWAQSH